MSNKTRNIPPHINKSAHDAVMSKLLKMTPAQIAAVAVKVGIYDEKGNLTEEYGGEKTHIGCRSATCTNHERGIES